ncbi:hypothetical protein E8E13_009662 [Curvularia kusanoi]|uniref:Uncharacterized protein n=1 Tax=Curvularia kusanoi TaxID=90978 RepID=A0A9P4TGS1_CURKU|nr:hypothetical protein E8E13_009662 [Curvularia kusanoi]
MPVQFLIPDQTQPGPQFAHLRRDPSPWPSPPSPRQESRCSRVLAKVKKSKMLTRIRCSKALAVINRFKTRLFDKINSPLSSRSGSLEQGDSHTAARVAQRYMEEETEDVGLDPFGDVSQYVNRVAMTSEIERGRVGLGIVSIGDSGSRTTARVASNWVDDDYEPPGEFEEVGEEGEEDYEEGL